MSWKGEKEWTGVGQRRTVCVLPDAGVEAACEKERKERKDPSTELGSPQVGPQANVGAGDVWFWVIWTEGVDDDVANAVFAKGMRLQGERGVRISETPFPFFFVSVR